MLQSSPVRITRNVISLYLTSSLNLYMNPFFPGSSSPVPHSDSEPCSSIRQVTSFWSAPSHSMTSIANVMLMLETIDHRSDALKFNFCVVRFRMCSIGCEVISAQRVEGEDVENDVLWHKDLSAGSA